MAVFNADTRVHAMRVDLAEAGGTFLHQGAARLLRFLEEDPTANRCLLLVHVLLGRLPETTAHELLRPNARGETAYAAFALVRAAVAPRASPPFVLLQERLANLAQHLRLHAEQAVLDYLHGREGVSEKDAIAALRGGGAGAFGPAMLVSHYEEGTPAVRAALEAAVLRDVAQDLPLRLAGSAQEAARALVASTLPIESKQTAAHSLLRALHGLDPDAEHTLASFLQPRAEAVAASRLGALEPELLRHIWWDLS